LVEAIAVKDNVSAAKGIFCQPEQLLAHSSAYKSPEHFNCNPKAGKG
jgi:hypothetical protein